MQELTSDFEYEEVIEKSRFICALAIARTSEQAKDFVAARKKLHYKANHSCSAWIVGADFQSSQSAGQSSGGSQHSSDDGEPSGTAGLPMLEVLRKQELTDVVAVVTRYFGGVKLGAGGLIREYGGCLARALAEAPRRQIIQLSRLSITLAYRQFDSCNAFLAGLAYPVTTVSSDFEQDIRLVIDLPTSALSDFQDQLTQHFRGQVTATPLQASAPV